MDVVRSLTIVGCMLLALAGAAKIRTPLPTVGAMRAVHLPSTRTIVRMVGAFEIALGLVAAITGQPIAMALVAVAYAAFLVFVAVAMRSGTDIQSCGCFGTVDTPPSWAHLVVNTGFMVIAAIAPFGPTTSLAHLVSHQPFAGVPFVLLIGVVTYLLVVALTVLPTVGRSARRSITAGVAH